MMIRTQFAVSERNEIRYTISLENNWMPGQARHDNGDNQIIVKYENPAAGHPRDSIKLPPCQGTLKK
jgi:hypothetical protein